MLEVNKLEFSYKSFNVLKEINIKSEYGKFISILGNNGAGKSTFLKCLVRILKPQNGTVLIDQKDLRMLSSDEVAKKFGYVPQRYTATRLTVFESILIGRKPHFKGMMPSKEDYDIVESVIEEFGLKPLSMRYLDELSGGELQKVVIARALAQSPKVLLLDEPVNNLDLKNQIEVLSLLKRMTRERKILVFCILHDLNLAIKFSDYFVFMKQGRIFAAGGHEVITPKIISSVYGIDVKIENAAGQPIVVPEIP